MKRFCLLMLFGAVLLLHFSTGVWSGDAPKEAAKNEVKGQLPEVKAEEKKAEEKKAPVQDKNGSATKDNSWATDKSTKLDEKSTPKQLAEAIGELSDNISINRSGINMFWTLMTGFLVMFMQAGFALVEAGLCRAKSVAHTMSMNFMIYAIGMLGFYFVGYGLMFGGYGTSLFGNDAGLLTSEYKLTIAGKELGIFGYEGFMLTGRAFDVSLLALFLFQMVFMDTTCTIPTGALAERWKFIAFVLFGCFISTIVYPIYGNWVWGGGWLAQLGSAFGLGHGHSDFAGSSVVHMTGGVASLAGVLILGSRIGKFNKDGSVNVLPAHNLPMYVLGTFILAFGWFGFNPGSSLKATDLNIARCAVNTMLASAAGAMTSMIYMWIVYKKPDPSFMCNGMLAGLVAITAPCAFITPGAAVLVGAVSGVLVIWSVFFWERICKIDDPVGAISVHGVNGAWGILVIGLLADGTYGQGWNGSNWYKVNETKLEWSAVPLTGETAKDALAAIEDGNKDKAAADKVEAPAFLSKLAPDAKLAAQGVTGIVYGNTGQLTAQIIGLLANIIWVFSTMFIFFLVVEKTIGNRVSAEDELAGLDIPEMGVIGYINDDPTTPEGHILHASANPRSAHVPSDGKNRYIINVEGVAADKLASVWTDLCKPGTKPPSPDFVAVYSKMTTFQGNRFNFVGGNPEETNGLLGRLLKTELNNTAVRTTVVK